MCVLCRTDWMRSKNSLEGEIQCIWLHSVMVTLHLTRSFLFEVIRVKVWQAVRARQLLFVVHELDNNIWSENFLSFLKSSENERKQRRISFFSFWLIIFGVQLSPSTVGRTFFMKQVKVWWTRLSFQSLITFFFSHLFLWNTVRNTVLVKQKWNLMAIIQNYKVMDVEGLEPTVSLIWSWIEWLKVCSLDILVPNSRHKHILPHTLSELRLIFVNKPVIQLHTREYSYTVLLLVLCSSSDAGHIYCPCHVVKDRIYTEICRVIDRQDVISCPSCFLFSCPSLVYVILIISSDTEKMRLICLVFNNRSQRDRYRGHFGTHSRPKDGNGAHKGSVWICPEGRGRRGYGDSSNSSRVFQLNRNERPHMNWMIF